MMNKFSSFIPAALLATGVALSANVMPADAFSIGFNNVTNNGSTDVAPNFTVDVSQIGEQIQFTFTNTLKTAYSTINEIYFGTKSAFPNYLSGGTIVNSSGVKFSEGANPNNPKGGIKWDAAFSADPDSPGGFGKNAVDPGESVSFVFNLVSGKSLLDIENGFKSGELVLALHAQSIGGSGGYSDWFASHSSVTSNDVPEPFTILGTGAAIGFAGLFRREQSKRQNKSKVKA